MISFSNLFSFLKHVTAITFIQLEIVLRKLGTVNAELSSKNQIVMHVLKAISATQIVDLVNAISMAPWVITVKQQMERFITIIVIQI